METDEAQGIDELVNETLPEEEEEIVENEEEEGTELEENSDTSEIALLRAQFEQQSQILQQLQEKLLGQKPDEVQVEEIDFFEDMEDSEYSKELNGPLNKVFRKGAELGYEKAIQKLPEIVGPLIQRKLDAYMRFHELFTENPELAKGKNKAFVHLRASELANMAENSNKSWEEFKPILIRDVKNQLKMKKVQSQDRTPASSSSRKPTQSKKNNSLEARLQSDVMDLLGD